MNFFLISCILALAAADVSHIVTKNDRSAQIIKYDLNSDPIGSYEWVIETENGINIEAEGHLTDPKAENPEQVVQGKVKWTAPDGQQIGWTYFADKDGYHPQGDILPTPPPIPPAILLALKYIQEQQTAKGGKSINN